MYFQGKKTLWIARNPFRQSRNHQIWGPKVASRPLQSGFKIALSGQILARPPAAMSSGTPMEKTCKDVLFVARKKLHPSENRTHHLRPYISHVHVLYAEKV